MKFIAELCQNHNGDTETMIKMVQEASKAGATHVKLQHIFSKNLTFRYQFENGYEVDGKTLCIKRPYHEEFERLKKLEMDEHAIKKFIQICNEEGVVPCTTCFAREHINELYEIGFRSIKVASYDCASFQLLRELIKYDWEILVSTGATYDAEIEKASKILGAKETFSFLHCITIYPTPLNELNLNRMKFLRNFTEDVGFSDHTMIKTDGVKASIAALYYGAKIIERHFTILEASLTRDGPVSTSPREFAQITNFAKLEKQDQKIYVEEKLPNIKQYLGNEFRQLSHLELLNRNYYRGRFASNNIENPSPETMIFNWEEIQLK